MYQKVLQSLLLIALMMASMVLSGCVIGVKKEKTTLFVSPVPIPEAAKGVPVIATDEAIELGILDKDGTFRQKVPGYVVVDPWFYDKLIAKWNEGR